MYCSELNIVVHVFISLNQLDLYFPLFPYIITIMFTETKAI